MIIATAKLRNGNLLEGMTFETIISSLEAQYELFVAEQFSILQKILQQTEKKYKTVWFWTVIGVFRFMLSTFCAIKFSLKQQNTNLFGKDRLKDRVLWSPLYGNARKRHQYPFSLMLKIIFHDTTWLIFHQGVNRKLFGKKKTITIEEISGGNIIIPKQQKVLIMWTNIVFQTDIHFFLKHYPFIFLAKAFSKAF